MTPSGLEQLQERLAKLEAKDAIVTRLNSYGYDLDEGKYAEWAQNNFAPDCEVSMSFDSHKGREGLAAWMANALKDVTKGIHLSSNFDVTLEGDSAQTATMAKVRSKLHAASAFGGELSNCLTLGGIYNWTLRREGPGEPWLIVYCHFRPDWSRGNASLLEGHE